MRNNWDLTIIRASMGIQPDGAYLTNPDKATTQIERIVENAIAAGIYVIIDWHDHAANEHQAEAVEFFSRMAATYGDAPNVLYEPFNEPLGVDWSTVVRPYHEAVVSAIRGEDPDNVVIVGTPRWSQDVDVAASDPLSDQNVLYALHFYSCTHKATLRAKAELAYSRGLPLFVTEWGATHADGGTDGLLCLPEAATWLEWLAERKIGWTAWKLDNCERDSSCILMPNAPVSGGWTSQFLHGHALFVRANMQSGEEPAEPRSARDAGGRRDAGASRDGGELPRDGSAARGDDGGGHARGDAS
jgi:endoglucanase